MIKHWIMYLLALAGTFVFHIFYFGWYSWFLLLLMVCLPVFSFVVSILAMARIQLRLMLDENVMSGERTIKITLTHGPQYTRINIAQLGNNN